MKHYLVFLALVLHFPYATADSLLEDDMDFWGRQLEEETSLGDPPTATPVMTPSPTTTEEIRSPKSSPTSSPTPAPTYTQVQAIIDLTFNVIYALEGLSVLQVPTNGNLDPFLDAVSSPLTDVFVPGNITVNVINVGGLGIGRRLRRLEETAPSIEIEIMVQASRQCFRPVCDQEAADFYLYLYKEALSEVAQSGDLTQAIREEADRLGVAVLLESTVAPTSCRILSSSFEIHAVENDDDAVDDDETTSDARKVSLHSTAIVGLTLLSLMVMG